jgi:integrase/recombinase XerD
MGHQFVREPLRAEEADRLANACQSIEEKLIVWTLLDTGLRVSELCSLTLDSVQWQQRAIRVAGKGGPHGTRSKQRIVPLSARVRAILEPYFALNDAWFVGTRQVQKIVKRVAGRAKLTREVTPHVLRHTWATLALQKGISLAAVQKILGHERLTTTAIYLNLTEGHVLEEFEAKW